MSSTSSPQQRQQQQQSSSQSGPDSKPTCSSPEGNAAKRPRSFLAIVESPTSPSSCSSFTRSQSIPNAAKCRRTKLSLKKTYLERSSQSSSENLLKFEYDTQSSTSLSISTAVVSEPSSVPPDYESIAAEFKINVSTVKKHYSILTSKPRVPIIRTLPIKKELSPISPIHNLDKSPIFQSRQRKLRRKSQIKTEPLPTDTPARKVIKKHVSQKLQNYFDTLETAKLDHESNSSQELKDQEFRQQNGEQSQSSKSNNTRPTHTSSWQLILDSSDSENDFEGFENSNVSKSNIQPLTERNRTLVTNPFSKLKNKASKKIKNSQSSQNSQTKNTTFWTKHFSSDDSLSKKKEKFLNTFKIKKENESEHSDNDIAYLGTSLSKSKKNEAKAIHKKHTSKTKSKQSQLSKPYSSSTESCEQSLNNSLSVNCQPLFTKNSKKKKKNNSVSSSCTQSSIPLSFGGDHSHIENDNNQDVKKPSTNPRSQMHSTKKSSEPSHKTKNLGGNEQSNFIESSKSLGCGNISPTNSDCLSPLKEELLRASTPEPSNAKDITKSKAKPKIISDNILLNNAIILPSPQNAHKKRLQLKLSPDFLTKSNDVVNRSPRPIMHETNVIEQKASNKNASESSAKPEINGITQSLSNVKNVSLTATSSSRGNLRSKLALKTNSDSTSIQSTKIQSKLSTSLGKVEESFESLCQDLTELSSYENVTLYKGDQDETIDLKSEKVVLRLSGDNFTDTDFKLPMVLDSNEDGKESTSSKTSSRISPIIFGRNRPLKRPVRSPTPTAAERNVSQFKPFTRPFQRQPSHDQTSSLRPRSATIAYPQSNAAAPLTSLSKSWSLLNKDPRLNRSISPPKTVSERDPRLNRSISPTKTASERDPRLNRSMSQLEATGVIITDPRLIRGKSAPANDTTSYTEGKIVDPRLRKRKEREEAERAAKIVKGEDIGEDKNDVTTQSAASEDSDSPVQAAKRRKLSVFGRLGLKKTRSPERKSTVVPNEILNIIKTRKESPKQNANWETDDDELSLHPGETIFSSDEETNSSPRHRKFISERSRTTEELNNQSIPIRDRLNWNTPGVNRRVPPRLVPPPSMSTATSTRRFNSHQPGQIPPLLSQTMKPPKIPQPLLNAPATKIPSAYGSGSVFNENFYKMNTAQMLKDVDNFRTQELQDNSYVTFGSGSLEKTTKFDHVSMLDGPNEPVQIGMSDVKTSFFKSYCFRMLRKGKCTWEQTKCTFSHQVIFLRKLISQKKPDVIVSILEAAIQNEYDFFLKNVWDAVLPALHNEAFVIFEKMYQKRIRSEHVIHTLLEYCLVSKLHTAESFIKRISPIIEKGDRDAVQIICTEIKSKLTDGFCWETIKDLCQKAIPPHDLIELTMIQCLKRKKNQSHIQEVYDLVKNKMNVLDRNKLSPSLLKQFYNLVQSKDFSATSKEVMNTVPLMTATTNTVNFGSSKEKVQIRRQSNDSVKSIESDKLVQPLTAKTKRAYSCQIASPAEVSGSDEQPNGSPVEVLKTTPNRGESTNFTEYIVSEVDSDEPTSSFRDRFWKLYHAVQGVNEGLNHVDYEYVWKTMDRFCKENTEDGELVKRAYYHILCKNVKNCERHITEIVKQAVRGGWSASRRSVELLFDTGVCALIDLTNSNLWVMALELLSSVKILEPDEPRTDFVLISAEILLANNDPLEALYLLQRTKLIRTNRDEWLVKDCTRDDEVHRNKIIFILLKALSFVDIEKAAYLFKTLIDDQYISYYPIDLPLYLDKLTLLLILQNKNDLVADISRLVMDNDLTFQKSTYQELLTHTLPFDEVLANQILDYAIHLGYYNDIQIRNGFTTIILDSNSTEEEVYLILKRLVHKLLLSVGPVVYRLKPNQLKVILIFEDIPSEKRLHRNELAVMTRDKYKDFRNVVIKLLATRFSPPIRIALQRWKGNRFCKIISRSLVEYLKHWI